MTQVSVNEVMEQFIWKRKHMHISDYDYLPESMPRMGYHY